MGFEHIPVLLDETVDALDVRPGETAVDCTAGGGSHSAAILERLGSDGRLICIDRDPDAVAHLKGRFAGDERVSVIHDNYNNISAILTSLSIPRADRIMADLGVSSYQLDEVERGFSFHSDAPLDMRMSKTGVSASDIVNSADEKELVRILREYGEEKFASRIAQTIIRKRQKEPILTTLQLSEAVSEAYPAAARRSGHPARKTFQALRIEVNGELRTLEDSLFSMFDSLNVGGRLAIISFHSLEDRIVKRTFTSLASGCTCPPEFPVCVCGKKPRGRICQKPVTPSQEELERNPRSRSAKLRVIEKL